MARNRLYQTGIALDWAAIEKLYNVYAYPKEKGWQPFSKNINYEAFIALREIICKFKITKIGPQFILHLKTRTPVLRGRK